MIMVELLSLKVYAFTLKPFYFATALFETFQTTWEHWNLDDSARAECPLTDDYVDTFPMGVTVDFTSQTPIPRGKFRETESVGIKFHF